MITSATVRGKWFGASGTAPTTERTFVALIGGASTVSSTAVRNKGEPAGWNGGAWGGAMVACMMDRDWGWHGCDALPAS